MGQMTFSDILKVEIKQPKIVELFISDKFREIISQFYQESTVAQLLLQRHHDERNLVDGYVNYISVCNKDANMISYLDQDRMESKDPNFDFWTFKKRVVCKPGGFVKRLFRGVGDREIEYFSNYYKATVNKKPNEFRVVTGEEIRKYYLANNYSQQRGSLGASCMKYNHSQPLMDFYISNPEVVSMVVLLDSSEMAIGRALLWNYKDNKVNDVKIMDRIYTIQDERYQIEFKQWATKNGYLCKAQQSFSNTFWLENAGKPVEFQTELQLNKFKFDKYPYLDTFKWMNTKTGVLTNYRPLEKSDVVTLAAPDGSMHNYDYLNLCDVSRVYHYGHEIAYLPYINKNVHGNLIVYSETNDGYILKGDSIYSEDARDNIFKDLEKNNQKALEKRIEFFKKEEDKKKAMQKIHELEERSRIERVRQEFQRRSHGIDWSQFTSAHTRMDTDQAAQLINDIRNLRTRGANSRELNIVLREVSNAMGISLEELINLTEPALEPTNPSYYGRYDYNDQITYTDASVSQADLTEEAVEVANPSIEVAIDTTVETTSVTRVNQNQRTYMIEGYWNTYSGTPTR